VHTITSLNMGLVSVLIAVATLFATQVRSEDHPRYKPSSRSAEAMDIRTNTYGASLDAPDALGVGDLVADFTLPRAGGGQVSLQDRRASGPVVLIFYRGHW